MNLILEFLAVDAGSSPPRARRITALDHEIFDDPVEDDSVIITPLSERGKVPACLWGVLVVELYHYCALLFCLSFMSATI